jgi:hypothetical protein
MTSNTETKTLTKEDFYTTIFSAQGRDAKKNLLIDLSNSAKLILEMNPDAGINVNDVIINRMYKSNEHQEFNTFKGWQEKGFTVKKGSKSFFIWSKPRKADKSKKEENAQKEEKNQYKFFGIAYLFSNSQVEATEKKTSEKLTVTLNS